MEYVVLAVLVLVAIYAIGMMFSEDNLYRNDSLYTKKRNKK